MVELAGRGFEGDVLVAQRGIRRSSEVNWNMENDRRYKVCVRLMKRLGREEHLLV